MKMMAARVDLVSNLASTAERIEFERVWIARPDTSPKSREAGLHCSEPIPSRPVDGALVGLALERVVLLGQ